MEDEEVCVGGHAIESNATHSAPWTRPPGRSDGAFRRAARSLSLPPAVAQGVGYIASGDGYVYALDTTTLEKRWVPQRPTESGL